MTTPMTVDDYLAAAPAAAQPMLAEIRRIVVEAVPSASESLKYGMPSYAVRGEAIVHFAAAKSHVAVYGLVHVDGDIPAELAPYLAHRSTLQFKFGDPLPAAALEERLRQKAAAVHTSE